MPYDSGTKDISMVEQFSEVLAGISNLIRIYDPSDIVIGGDMNTEFSRHSAHTVLLKSFCENESLHNAKEHNLSTVDFTYCNYATGVTSTIDHFLLSDDAYCLINSVQIAHSGLNLSDH